MSSKSGVDRIQRPHSGLCEHVAFGFQPFFRVHPRVNLPRIDPICRICQCSGPHPTAEDGPRRESKSLGGISATDAEWDTGL
jgi:hypothetical protein